MTRLKQSEPVRLCPACSAGDRILGNERLWPPGWRCPSCGYAPVVRAEIPCLAPALDGEDVGFDPRAFEPLARIEDRHFWFRTRNDLIAWLLRRHARDARQILEIGCGTGFVLHALRAACPNANVAGSELHSVGLSFARARHGAAVELIQADARRLCLREALDVVCALDVLEHIEDDAAVLSEIRAALRNGGVLIAAVPQHPWLWSASDELARHVRRYRKGEIENKARAAGFDVRFADSFVSLLLPAMALSRVMSRIGSQRDKPAHPEEGSSDPVAREFKIGLGLNEAMRAVLRLEQLLRRAGLRSPIGGSRVIVAQKRG
jgi:SAM-dependent methyltransferase